MFLQACGVLWFMNILCVVCFGVLCICIDDYMHDLYIPDMRHVGVMTQNVHEPQHTIRLQKHTHSQPHMTHNIGIALTAR